MTRTTSYRLLSYVFVTVVLVVLFPVRTAAWGNKGHQVIARIAMERLSTDARQSIAELLDSGETLESISTWADQIRLQRADTRSWHFVEIPLNDSRYVQMKACGKGQTCIIEAITKQLAILKDPSNDPKARAEALKFVVHFIGDLHQPFHVSTNTNPPDDGANQVRVTSLSGRATRLHDVWDNDLVEFGLGQAKSVGDYATQLGRKYGSAAMNKMNQRSLISTQGSPTDWALETHKLCWNAYYHTSGDFMVNNPKRSWKLDQEYYNKNLPVVEGQLVRAGLRLAKILNDTFAARAAR